MHTEINQYHPSYSGACMHSNFVGESSWMLAIINDPSDSIISKPLHKRIAQYSPPFFSSFSSRFSTMIFDTPAYLYPLYLCKDII